VRRLYDTHVHVWTMDEEKYPWNSILSIAKVPAYAFTAEQLLSEMDGEGVERAVLVQPSTYGWNNLYLIETLQKYPERFQGIVLADPADPAIEQQLITLGEQPGVVGVRFHLLEARQVEVFRAASERVRRGAREAGLAVTFQAHPGTIGTVTEFANAAPDLTIVLDHLGLIWSGDQRLRGLADLRPLAALPNVCVKLSAIEAMPDEPAPFGSKAELVSAVVGAFGPDRTMWGSNFPHGRAAGSYGEVAGAMDCLLPTLGKADRDIIGWKTAETVWSRAPRR
jgi:predicted TIM-barrel fold metal-dependent hydrolase